MFDKSTSKPTPRVVLRLSRPNPEQKSSTSGVEKQIQKLKLNVRKPEPAENGSSNQLPKIKLIVRKPVGGQSSAPEPTEQQREVQAAIQAALCCKGGCSSTPSEEMMHADLKSGIYDPARDLAYGYPDEGLAVDPLDNGQTSARPGFFGSATTEQLVILQRARSILSPLQCYSFFRHIHQHHLIRNGFIRNMCHDKEDIGALKDWSWRLALQPPKADETVETDDPPPPPPPARSGRHASERIYRRMNWPYDTERVKTEIRVWSSEEDQRKARSNDTRRRWEQILAERERQRRRIIRNAGPNFDDGRMTARQIKAYMGALAAAYQTDDGD